MSPSRRQTLEVVDAVLRRQRGLGRLSAHDRREVEALATRLALRIAELAADRRAATLQGRGAGS
jgi:hypothetical protein